MTRDEIFERVSGFIAEHFELDPASIKMETRFFDDLGLDSIDAVELVIELGDLTGESINEDHLRNISTISDIVSLVEKLRQDAKK